MFKKNKNNKNNLHLGALYIESCTGTHPHSNFNKIGRLSLKGICNKKKVKIFQCYNNTHADFVCAVMSHPLYAEFFPKVYGVQGSIIISEWVEGQTLQARNVRNDEFVLKKIDRFFQVIHGDVPSELAKLDYGFDYCKDLLETRFMECCHALGLPEFYDRVMSSVKKAYKHSSIKLSHPDISPANILITQNNSQLKIIDNELIGMSSFYHFDLINFAFFLRDQKTELTASEQNFYKATQKILSNLGEEDVMNLWLMRYVGAKFQAGDVRTALSVSENSFSENVEAFPFLARFF